MNQIAICVEPATEDVEGALGAGSVCRHLTIKDEPIIWNPQDSLRCSS